MITIYGSAQAQSLVNLLKQGTGFVFFFNKTFIVIFNYQNSSLCDYFNSKCIGLDISFKVIEHISRKDGRFN